MSQNEANFPTASNHSSPMREGIPTQRGEWIVLKPNISNISPKAVIGTGTRIHAFVSIHDEVIIGKDCSIQDGAKLFNGVTIEDDVFIGPGVITTNDRNLTEPFEVTKTLIKKGAKVGAGSILIAGVTIGEGAVVGAGTVVTKNIPHHEVWVGNPCRYLKDVIL